MLDNFNQHLEQIRNQFIAGLPQRAHHIEDLWHKLRYLNWSPQGLKVLHNLTHKLAGSGASFGLPDISEAAQILDTYLQEHLDLGQPLGGIEREIIDQMVACLVQLLNHNNHLSEAYTNIPLNNIGKQELIFLIDDDQALSSLITAYLEACGFKVLQFNAAVDCLNSLHQKPQAIVMDVGIHGEDLQGLESIEPIKVHIGNNIPIILLSARTDIHARVRALRAGCTHYLSKPVDFIQLTNTLTNAIHHRETSHKVMIVDDEELVAQYHAEILRHAGMDVIYITNPLQSLQRAVEFQPDLVILDMHMPDINGMELATLLREEDQFLALPIIFVTADTSTVLHNSLESLGVNGVLTKPVNIQQLISCCEHAISDTVALKNRIARVTQRAAHHQQITRSYFFSAIDNLLEQQLISNNSIAVYYIGVDTIDQIHALHGQTGGALLHEQFCAIMARIIGTDEQWTDISNLVVCVLASHATREHHKQRALQIIAQLNEFIFKIKDEHIHLHCSIGIDYLDTESGSANSVLRHAEQAYDIARTEGTFHEAEYNLKNNNQSNFTAPSIDFSAGLPTDNLCVSYQPMISFEEQHIEHFEALIRWRTDSGELIPAAKFLHCIEHSSMHADLDRWVLKTAIDAITNDINTRDNTNLFIHLSEETLKEKSFFTFAANTIHHSRLRGQKRVIFMLEEEWIPLHPELTVEVIKHIHDAHCGVCLSHAGATNMTEQSIQNLEIDYIKLTPSLTKTLDAERTETQYLNNIVTNAKIKQIKIIATQVEDSKNLSTLWLLGVRLFQGFFIQSPDQKFHTKTDMDFVKQLLSPNET